MCSFLLVKISIKMRLTGSCQLGVNFLVAYMVLSSVISESSDLTIPKAQQHFQEPQNNEFSGEVKPGGK